MRTKILYVQNQGHLKVAEWMELKPRARVPCLPKNKPYTVFTYLNVLTHLKILRNPERFLSIKD